MYYKISIKDGRIKVVEEISEHNFIGDNCRLSFNDYISCLDLVNKEYEPFLYGKRKNKVWDDYYLEANNIEHAVILVKFSLLNGNVQ